MREFFATEPNLHSPEPAVVLSAQELSATEKLFRFRLASGRALGHVPGQFVMITLPGIGAAPISVCSSPTDEGWFELGIRRYDIGNMTPSLHRLQAGDTVFVSRPMGNGFPVEKLFGKDLVLVAGGIGLFPLRSLIRFVRAKRSDFGYVAIVFGAKNPDERLLPDEIAEWKRDTSLIFLETVDRGNDAWHGNVGLITTLIPKLPKYGFETFTKKSRAVVIGPDIMFKFVSLELAKLGVAKQNIYASTERKMSCGLGFCRNCLLPNGKRACVDGPVFSALELGL